MPVLVMAEPVVDHQKRFQAAVDVIHNLPKNGSYRPSYEVMLRFYSLYKQAMCGPCTVPRPSFWDPVGRCKWDAWSRLGEMSSENAMAAYVDEIKKVAQEVLDTMPMNEKTASLFHHFESLYLVIDDMPQPPESLFTLREGLKCSKNGYRTVEMKTENNEQDSPNEDSPVTEGEQADQDFSLAEVLDTIANTVPHDSGVSEGLMLTSDSENEIFCDSVDSVEQLSAIKVPVVEYNGFHNSDVAQESFPTQSCQLEGGLVVRQVGAGQGGEGTEDGKGQGHLRRTRDSGQEGSYHGWRECGVPQGRQRQGAQGGGGGARRGGDGSEDATERVLDAQLQQQIILALRRLREDMRSVMDRLEVVERLAATNTQSSQQRPYLHCEASTPPQQEEGWLPFDVSCQTIFFLLWPFVTQGLVYLLRKTQRRSRISS